MARWTVFVSFVTALVGVGMGGAALGFEIETLESMSDRMEFFEVLEDGPDGAVRIIFADARDHVHVYKFEGGTPRLDWEATSLGSSVTGLVLEDLEGDGVREICIATAGGRVLVYNGESYDLVWENLQDPFESISCMLAADIDDDPQAEIILLADGYLHGYDGSTKTPEWKSSDEFEARRMCLANVDDDEQLELILNTGVVFDTRFYSIEFESDVGFGDRMSLFDVNGDGIPEVFGETAGGPVRIFDIYAERELW